MRARLAPLAAAIAVVLVACNEAAAPVTPEPTPTATPTAQATPTPQATPATSPIPEPTPTSEPIALDEDGLPVGAVGPILAYTTPADREDPHGEFDYHRVFLYDAGAGEHIGSFEVAQRPLLAGREILVAYRGSVDAYQLDGSRDRTVVETEDEERLGAATVSPNGELLALTRHRDGGTAPGTVEIIDVSNGRDVVRLDASALQGPDEQGRPWPEGWVGWPIPCCWSSDGTLLVMRGVVDSSAPGTFGHLTLDGELVSYGIAEWGLVDPTGLQFAYGEGAFLTMEDPFIHDNLRVLHAAEGSSTTIAEDGEFGFAPREWAPDGTALLYEILEPADEGPEAGRSEVPGFERRELRLYDFTSGEDIEAPSLHDPRAEWYGERAVVGECEDGSHPRSPWHQPQALPACESGPTTILLAGEAIDEVRDPRILGWIEADE